MTNLTCTPRSGEGTGRVKGDGMKLTIPAALVDEFQKVAQEDKTTITLAAQKIIKYGFLVRSILRTKGSKLYIEDIHGLREITL